MTQKEMQSSGRNLSAPNAAPVSSWQRTRTVYRAVNADTPSSARKSKEGYLHSASTLSSRGPQDRPVHRRVKPLPLPTSYDLLWTRGIAWILSGFPEPLTRVRIPAGPLTDNARKVRRSICTARRSAGSDVLPGCPPLDSNNPVSILFPQGPFSREVSWNWSYP